MLTVVYGQVDGLLFIDKSTSPSDSSTDTDAGSGSSSSGSGMHDSAVQASDHHSLAALSLSDGQSASMRLETSTPIRCVSTNSAPLSTALRSNLADADSAYATLSACIDGKDGM